jgi:hypothetical protein
MIETSKRCFAMSSLALLGVVAACNETSGAVPAAADPSTPIQSPVAVADDPGDDTAPSESGQEGDEPGLPVAAGRPPSGDNSARALLAEVDRELGRMRSSAYTHATQVDEVNGVFDFDCSGFAGYALSAAAPAAWGQLQTATTGQGRRPLAKHFQAFFASLPVGAESGHWQRVARVSDLQAGDVVAWVKPPDVVSKNTGHVVIVHGPVTPVSERPGAFLVPVADSTSVPHGRGDSRKPARATGLGTGMLVLVADARGAPTAYRWSLGNRAVEHPTTLAMARLASH